MSTTILVIGNGKSRLSYSLTNDDNTIGCNALYRDFTPDMLVACDKPMVDEIVKNNLPVYTRQEWKDRYKHNRLVAYLPNLPYIGYSREDQSIHWGSGSYALYMACLSPFKYIKLIGFDLYNDSVYKGSQNYDDETPNPSYLIYQMSKMFELYPSKIFEIYNHSEWKMPNEWSGFSNVYKKSY